MLDSQEMIVFKTPKQHKKSAVVSSFVQSCPGSPKQNIHILSICNGTFFPGQIMYYTLAFLNEICKIPTKKHV